MDRVLRKGQLAAKACLRLNDIIHEKGCLAIMLTLVSGPATLATLIQILSKSQSNLVSHLFVLQQHGYVCKDWKMLSLSRRGTDALTSYKKAVRRLVARSRALLHAG